jgi:hypothetical protein
MLETTATAVLALHAAGNVTLSERGLAFLLRRKDRTGIWMTTQATSVVLDALVALAPAARGGSTTFDVVVDGVNVTTVESPTPAAPLTVDLTGRIGPGRHHVEIRRDGAREAAVAALGATYYARWEPDSLSRDGSARSEAAGLRFAVTRDRTRASATDPIECAVEVARSSLGGMLLAEIGLPPGADVDRSSLERAAADQGASLSGYDVLPDRVVLYLWSWSGAATVRFTFRPRYAMSALAAPSTLTDYYDPDTRIALAPPRFEITGRADR